LAYSRQAENPIVLNHNQLANDLFIGNLLGSIEDLVGFNFTTDSEMNNSTFPKVQPNTCNFTANIGTFSGAETPASVNIP